MKNKYINDDESNGLTLMKKPRQGVYGVKMIDYNEPNSGRTQLTE